MHIASDNTTLAADVPQLQQNVYLNHSVTAWKHLVRGAPAAGVLAATDPKAVDVVRAVPTGSKPVRLGRNATVVAGYLAKPARFSSMSRGQRFRILRWVELARVADHRVRHGIGLKADAWLRAMASVSDAETLSRWAKDFLPTIALAEIDDAIEGASRDGGGYTAQEIGDLIGLTVEEREGIDVRTVRPAGMSRRAFADYARERKLEFDRRRDEERRRAAGVKPRRKGESAKEEAEREGVSVATIYRRRARGKAEAACEAKSRQVHQEDMAEFRLARAPKHEEAHATAGEPRRALPLIVWPRFFAARSSLIRTRAPLTASISPTHTDRPALTIALRADAQRLGAWMAHRRAA